MYAFPPFTMPVTADHIHPILVNFTAALVPASLVSDMLGRLTRKRSLTYAAWWMLLYAALITPLTAAAGLRWKRAVSDSVPPATLRTHQWLGLTLALIFLVLALWRRRIHVSGGMASPPYLVLLFVAVILLIYQGSLGGIMLFGR
jgi:uncharacterized membrane protein